MRIDAVKYGETDRGKNVRKKLKKVLTFGMTDGNIIKSRLAVTKQDSFLERCPSGLRSWS